MKPPDQVFPQRKAAEFDATGRPFHSFFYTGKANFFKLLFVSSLHCIAGNYKKINLFFKLFPGHCRTNECYECI